MANEVMVPGAGIEPARPLSRGILSPLRLPISPPGLTTGWALIGSSAYIGLSTLYITILIYISFIGTYGG